MAMLFKTVAPELIKLLFMVFLLGSFFLMLPARQPNACGLDFHVRVFRTHHYLVLAVVVTAALLVLVQAEVSRAEADCVSAARATAGSRARREDAAADAVAKGVGAIAAKWHRVSLRALLLLAVVLAFAASLLAIVTFDDGFLFWTGCDADHAGYGAGSPMGVVMMVHMALVHGHAAWVAVCQN